MSLQQQTNDLIATEIMEWQYYDFIWRGEDEEISVKDWNPSEDLAQAFRVIEKIVSLPDYDDGVTFELQRMAVPSGKKYWLARIGKYAGSSYISASAAICDAVILKLAVGETE